MCKMATVQIFLEHSNRDVHVGIGFVRNRNMSAGPIKDQPYPLCWRHQAQWMLHVTSNSSFSLLHIQAPTTVSLSTTADVAVVSKGRYDWLISYWSPTMHKFPTVFHGRSATWPNFASNAASTCWLRHQAAIIKSNHWLWWVISESSWQSILYYTVVLHSHCCDEGLFCMSGSLDMRTSWPLFRWFLVSSYIYWLARCKALCPLQA